MPGVFDWWIFGLSSFEERVKEASSSEASQKKGPVCTYSDSLESPRSVPMQSHLGSVVLCLVSTLRGWVQSSSELLRELWESVQPLQS